MQSRGDVQGILDILESGNSLVKSRAILALKQLQAVQAIPKLKALRETEGDPEMRRLIDHALEVLGKNQTDEDDPESRRSKLLQQMKSPNTDAAELAIREFGRLGDRTIIEHLIVIFRDLRQPARLRLAAAESLLLLESAPASASLLGALRKSDWRVRRNAAAILGQMRSDWAVKPLIEAMRRDPNQYVRKTAMAALQRIGTEEALQAVQAIQGQRPNSDVMP
jgi:HEAT repeat protein